MILFIFVSPFLIIYVNLITYSFSEGNITLIIHAFHYRKALNTDTLLTKAVAAALPEGSTTVGTAMQTSHVKASKMGATITASARLVEVDGRRLRFEVRAWDEAGTIGEGEHTRFVVDRERFLAKLG